MNPKFQLLVSILMLNFFNFTFAQEYTPLNITDNPKEFYTAIKAATVFVNADSKIENAVILIKKW